MTLENCIADAQEIIIEECVYCGSFSHYLNDEGVCRDCLNSIKEERERE